MTNAHTLILGGVRSGKSRLAEKLAIESQLPVTYIATATAQDEEMRQRITTHQKQRPDHWQIVEEPIQLAKTLSRIDKEQCILLDCLTLWLTNLLLTEDSLLFTQERETFLSVLPALQNHIIIVSNETNMGITPMGELSRRYCDEAGRLHQEVALHCDQVILTVAGLPHTLKGEAL